MKDKILHLFGVGPFYVFTIFLFTFLTFLMKKTEEKWLLEKFGKEYEEYCKNVNRCFPWFRY